MLELDLSKSESLSEGGFLDLSKNFPKLKIAQVGLGWNTNEDPNGPNFDLDVSAFLLNADGKVPGLGYVVFHKSKNKNEDGRPYSEDGSVLGSIDVIGDDDDDDDDGDKEDIIIYFDHVSPIIHEIAITVSISMYPNDAHGDPRTKNLNFGMVNNSYIHMWDAETSVEVFRYDLKKNFSNEQALLFGKFKRTPKNEWEFHACGDGCQGDLNALGKMLKFF
jgi:tellurium resistance protein TerD